MAAAAKLELWMIQAQNGRIVYKIKQRIILTVWGET